MKKITEYLAQLRSAMKKQNIRAYIVCTDDFHGSEYVGDYFKVRQFLSGFTGSAGTLVVLEDEAALWTDGRYFLQAATQLEGSTIALMKSGQPGVPTIEQYLAEKLSDNDIIGFDGRTITATFANQIKSAVQDKHITFAWDCDLVDSIWSARPELSKEPVWELDASYTGMTREEKLAQVRSAMAENGADVFVLTALDEIAWLLNLRGNDVACSPVFLSYMLIYKDTASLYCNESIIDSSLQENLAGAQISLKPYDSFYQDLKHIPANKNVLLDTSKANFKVTMCLPEDIILKDTTSPITLLKAVKTKEEVENMRRAHIKDGVAVTKFMYWLKHNIGKVEMSELSVSKVLEDYRKEQPDYLGPSFAPIVGYGPHGAIIHYSCTDETNSPLEPKSLLLVDTGAQYLQGTTDITRTYALGETTDDERKAFTLVLIGHLNLGAAKFLHGTAGGNLDILAREPLWRYGLDYNHGTGHGVGYLLNVHEGPNCFRYQLAQPNTHVVFEDGMITSNEPGLYIAGKFGIRHENLIVCKHAEENEFGNFLCFENLTMVPFDLDAIDTAYMSLRDIELLNAYHQEVYDKIAPFLDTEEKAWLAEATRPIVK